MSVNCKYLELIGTIISVGNFVYIEACLWKI